MEIVYKKVKELVPYDKNPRKNDKAVPAVKASIQEFGFKVPIVIDSENVVVCGHTRLKAAKSLKIKEVPCVVADDLTEEQIKAFRLADNKVSEQAEWDIKLMDDEMENIFQIDMTAFGFSIAENMGMKHQENQEDTQFSVENIQNLGYAQYDGTGKYDIPEILPTYEVDEIKEWIGFNYVLSDKNPEGKAVHFFIDDYQFERLWNNPDKYVEKLRQYVCVAAPDFSPYGDMPLALQIYNHYRKHWVAAYLQERGVTVIPTIRASTDKRSLEWYLEGEPKESIVMISSMWTKTDEQIESFMNEYKTMYKALKPTKIFVYGSKDIDLPGNTEFVKSFASKRWEKGDSNG